MSAEEQFDRLVRDADPGRLGVLGDIGGVKQDLLEEILSESKLDRVIEMPQRRLRVRGFAGVVAAAAVLVSVVPVSIVVRGQSEGRGVSPIATVDPGVVFSPLAMAAAQRNPRLLIDRSGWKVTDLSGFTEELGMIRFRRGGQELEMNWYPASGYAGRYADRLQVNRPKSVRVDGWPGDLFEYSGSDFAVLTRPREDVFVEMRTSGDWSRKEFARVLADIVRVDARTWLAALPAEMVMPVGERAAKVLVDVPLPPGFDVAALEDIGVSDSYHFSVGVTSRVGCGWIAEWQRARASGDEAAVRRAADALRGSHGWRVLRDLDKAGDWSEVFWEYADEIAAGTLRASYSQGLGCA
ncbi:hypothetical protein PSN13_00401 [Micromonospora saelicesensis]|uniref:Uncharacterized protein n=1 Tax=Micromonospora saelicesensis TaxID=285676 RepID=A0A328NVJ3_9ACTN|nr:hypothetical protein [Micromonospora saelicesensis]RAO39377.1 hypothetical protein PSN13_00401 [Micromonospora saelicesensis]